MDSQTHHGNARARTLVDLDRLMAEQGFTKPSRSDLAYTSNIDVARTMQALMDRDSYNEIRLVNLRYTDLEKESLPLAIPSGMDAYSVYVESHLPRD